MTKNYDPIEVPVLIIVFNRPGLTKKLVQRLKKFDIKNLHVFADGPRQEHPQDQNKCEKVRNIIESDIDWDCELSVNFQDQNLGCGYGPVEAITWFFNQVESGIILEDDIKPSYSFFPFCRELLNRYRDQRKVMHITGLNWQNGKKRGYADYYFSYYPGIWGWATWADRWKLFDHDLFDLDEFLENKRITDITTSEEEQKYHLNSFQEVLAGKDHIWDLAWKYTVFNKKGYCIWPNKNLTANIGFGDEATHTKDRENPRFDCPVQELNFPLKHPGTIERNVKADRFMARRIFKAKFPGDSFINYLRKHKHKLFKG